MERETNDMRDKMELKRYQDAEGDGHLLYLPCTVGDTAWQIVFQDGKPACIRPFLVRSLVHIATMLEDGVFGKTVFLDEPSASAAFALLKQKDAQENDLISRSETTALIDELLSVVEETGKKRTWRVCEIRSLLADTIQGIPCALDVRGAAGEIARLRETSQTGYDTESFTEDVADILRGYTNTPE